MNTSNPLVTTEIMWLLNKAIFDPKGHVRAYAQKTLGEEILKNALLAPAVANILFIIGKTHAVGEFYHTAAYGMVRKVIENRFCPMLSRAPVMVSARQAFFESEPTRSRAARSVTMILADGFRATLE